MGEGHGVNLAVGLELQEQAVGPALMKLGVEGDRAVRAVLAVGVNVRVGELGGVQRDQVPVGTQVRLKVADGPALAGDAEGELCLLAGGELGGALQLDAVPVDRGLQRRRRQRDVVRVAGRGQVRPEDVLAAVDDEVGDRPVGAGAAAGSSIVKVPSELSTGCRCW